MATVKHRASDVRQCPECGTDAARLTEEGYWWCTACETPWGMYFERATPAASRGRAVVVTVLLAVVLAIAAAYQVAARDS